MGRSAGSCADHRRRHWHDRGRFHGLPVPGLGGRAPVRSDAGHARHQFSARSSFAPLQTAIDEWQVQGWSLDQAGLLHSFRLDGGQEFPPQPLAPPDSQLTASSFPTGSETVALGFADGTVRTAHIRFSTKFIDRKQIVEEPAVELRDAIDLDPDSQAAIEKLDHLSQGNSTLYCGLTADDKLWLVSIGKHRDVRTQEDQIVRRQAQLPLPSDALAEERPSHVLLAGSGDNVYVIWPGGRLLRFDTRNLAKVSLVEELNLLEDPGARLTAAAFLLGRGSMMTGDSTGRLRAWFRVRPASGDADYPANRTRLCLGRAARLRPRLCSSGFSDRLLGGLHAHAAAGCWAWPMGACGWCK